MNESDCFNGKTTDKLYAIILTENIQLIFSIKK